MAYKKKEISMNLMTINKSIYSYNSLDGLNEIFAADGIQNACTSLNRDLKNPKN